MLWLKRSSWLRKIADRNRPGPKQTASYCSIQSTDRATPSKRLIGARELSWTQHRLRCLAGGWL
jgi:hypothetical protein